LINSGRARLLDDQRLISQLCSLERRTARGGRDSIDHPPGAHDDVANAACGVLVGLEAAARNADYVSLKWVCSDAELRQMRSGRRNLWHHPGIIGGRW
jgi:hypothetical protein